MNESHYIIQIIFMLVPILIIIYRNQIVRKFHKIKTKENGYDIAKTILDANQINSYIVEKKSNYGDMFDGKRGVIRLTSNVYHQATVSSIVIASTQAFLCVQRKKLQTILSFRKSLTAVFNIIFILAYATSLFGIGLRDSQLLQVSLLLFVIAYVFHLICLCMDYSAAKKGKVFLIENKYLTEKEGSTYHALFLASGCSTFLGLLTGFDDLLELFNLKK